MNYTDYLIEYWLEESAKTDFIDKFGDELFNNFNKAKDRLKSKNLPPDYQQYLKYSPEELTKFLVNLYDSEKDAGRIKNISGETRNVRGEYKYLGKFGKQLVYQPLDYISSMDLGINTGQCTTGRQGHAGDPNFTPSPKDAKENFNKYTDEGVKLYYFLNPQTFYGEWAVALYPKKIIPYDDVFIFDKPTGKVHKLISANFKLFNSNDGVTYDQQEVIDICNNEFGLNLWANLEDTGKCFPDGFEYSGSVLVKCQDTSIRKVKIPDGVTEIGDCAFQGCSRLQSVKIPNSVTYIGHGAFYNCSSLPSIIIPDSVTQIGYEAFDNCSSLKSIEIPNSINALDEKTFLNCTSLQSIEIPNSVIRIGMRAFDGCTSLKSITIPNSVIGIGDQAFDGCSSLPSIEIPNSVTYIGESIFKDCTNLKSVKIPDSVTKIGSRALYGCTSLKTISYSGNNQQIIDELSQYAIVISSETGEILADKR